MTIGPFKTDLSVVGARYRVNLPLFKLSEQAGQSHTLHDTTTMLMTKFPLTEIFVIPSASVLYFGTKKIASTDFCNKFSACHSICQITDSHCSTQGTGVFF